jgi:hypothetical protein
MKRSVTRFLGRFRARSAARKERALQRALAEKALRDSPEASIWRTGKGGGHPDR